MSRLVDSLSRFFGRVEILARGAEDDRKAAEQAQQRGHVLEARSHARALLAKVPGSPLGLALWADAAEQCWLDDEVVVALSQLVEQMPWRSEVWLRLGLAGLRSDWTHAPEALQRAAAATDDPAVARSALLQLADLDLLATKLQRAGRWLDRVPTHPSQPDPELALRRAECALALGDTERARDWAKQLGAERGDGRVRLVRAQLAELWPDDSVGADALSLALAAHILGAHGASNLLARLIANSRDAARVDRARRILRTAGEHDEPQWRAAFAMAEGRAADAREALLAGVREGDALAAHSLLSLATEQRDIDALRALAEQDAVSLSPGLRLLLDAADHRAEGRFREALDKLDGVTAKELRGWAEQCLQDLIATWVPDSTHEPANWNELLTQLGMAATELQRLDLIGPIEGLAVERERPLFVAVLGEFNAGKSTFLNALLGTDVAPTGIRPTTASLHWVAWAPDPFARVVVHKGSDRVVPHAELKQTLQQLREEGTELDRVLI